MLSYLVGQDVQMFAMRLNLEPYFVYASSEDQPVYLRRLALASRFKLMVNLISTIISQVGLFTFIYYIVTSIFMAH